MVSIKDINKNIKKNLFDPIDKTKNKLSSLLNDFKIVNKRHLQLISVLKYLKNHLVCICEVMEGD